ncbi:MAG TPA: protein kinase, partial [Blastocatellia bacterium]|nr:protein kinase [Blastocatellia bacterium]
MGEVYKAEDLRLHRYVALKMMFVDGNENKFTQQLRARFLHEARAASALNHPNIATIYEIDEIIRNDARYSFIVMEYVPGRTLKEAGRELDLPESLEVVMQIAEPLAEAHDRGIVHRDIKSSNIIITEDRRAKLLDFGVAKYNPMPDESSVTASLYQTELMKTAPGTVIGTFAYMSPEQALGREVDGRSDIFSLGVLFYELIAKRLPFTGSSMLGVVDAILHADPLPVSMFNHQVSPDLERIVHRMLEKDVLRRHQTMRQVIADLEAVRSGMPVMVDPFETRVGEASPLVPAGSSGIRMLSRAGKSIAVMSFNNITSNPADDWIGSGIAETVTADLKRVEGLTVMGRERVYEVLRRWNMKGDEEVDETLATSVGREIGARWIICGGYQRVSEMLRITARFVEVDTGEVVKTVKIDGQMKDIFDLQDKIVYELSRDLDLSLRSGEREDIGQRETEVVEAYEAFVRAQTMVMIGSREEMERAAALFEEAIKLDPNYAQAYAGLGYTFVLRGIFFSVPELMERGIDYFQKAIELRPMLPDGYSGLGMAFVETGRPDEAIGALRRALSFAPHDYQVHAMLGRAQMLGKGLFREASHEYEQSLKLNPKAGWAALQLALCCSYLPDFERGLQAARLAVEAQEQYISGQAGMQIIGAFVRLGHLYYITESYDDAIAEYYRELVFLRQSNHALRERTSIEVH